MSTRSSQTPSPLAGRRVLLGVTGGIAAYKSCTLLRLLVAVGADVRVVMTQAATRFVGIETFAALSGNPVLTSLWGGEGAVPHVRAAQDADVVIVAPATANTLAKMAFGMADDVLSAILLEATVPVLVAPAMHSGMFNDPATRDNLRVLSQRGIHIVGPVEGKLAAGDEGVGRMVEPDILFRETEDLLARGHDLAGTSVVITAGATWEPIDAVRFIGNRSSGRMGCALASEAHHRGAKVRLVLGPGTIEPPPGIDVVAVTTTEEMLAVTASAFQDADVLVMAAAVADFRPIDPPRGKQKKRDGIPTIELAETPDILATLAASKGDRIVVGFAAETENFAEAAREKLTGKNADIVVVNEVGREGTGFGSEDDMAAIVGTTDASIELRAWTKSALARAIWDRVVKLRTER